MYYAIGSLVAALLLIFIFHKVFHIEKKSAREIMMLVILIALTVLGNLASVQVLPFQFGTAMVIISAVGFGPEAGFIVGAMARLIVNFAQGQGPWTPWEMMGWGILGILTGVFFAKREKNTLKNDIILVGWTFLSVFLLYGTLMNLFTFLFAVRYAGNDSISNIFIRTYTAGIPYDLLHAGRAAIAVFLLSNPVLKRIDRIKVKYGFYRIKRQWRTS